jgi:hypothetical protein
METVSKSKFARLVNIKRQSVDDLIKTRAINATNKNGKEEILLDGKLTRGYMASKGAELSPVIKSESSPVYEMDIEQAQITKKIFDAKHKKAMTEQTELRNAYIRGELMSRELVYDIMYFIDKIFSNVKRNGRAFLSDNTNRIAKKILDGESVTDILNEWDNLQMSALADAKEDFIKRIQEIEKKQASEA